MTPGWHPSFVVITAIETYGVPRTLERTRYLCECYPPGAVMVQLRDRQLGVRDRLAIGRELREITRMRGQGFTVNDRLDLALLLEADGVHLAENSASAEDVRALLGGTIWISRACHDPERATDSDATDAILLSPILAARKGRPALGLEGLKRARELIERSRAKEPSAARLQVYALGGLEFDSLQACEAAGADGIAVVREAWCGEGRL